MASSSTGVARGSSYLPYSRTNSGSSSSSLENLPPRTLSRVAKEVRDLVKNPPEGIRLVVDGETGLPSSLGEIVVRGFYLVESIERIHFGLEETRNKKQLDRRGLFSRSILR